jgi:hypothetical protein
MGEKTHCDLGLIFVGQLLQLGEFLVGGHVGGGVRHVDVRGGAVDDAIGAVAVVAVVERVAVKQVAVVQQVARVW